MEQCQKPWRCGELQVSKLMDNQWVHLDDDTQVLHLRLQCQVYQLQLHQARNKKLVFMKAGGLKCTPAWTEYRFPSGDAISSNPPPSLSLSIHPDITTLVETGHKTPIYLLTYLLSLCPSSSLLFQAYNVVCFKNTGKFKRPSITKISPLMFYLLLSVRWMQTGISFFVVIHQTKRSY